MRAHGQLIAPARPLRLLIVEDREDDLVLLLDELDRAGYLVSHVRVETAPALHGALADRDWDAVLSDFSLPTMTAHDVLRILAAERPDLPCIVISGTITEEAAVDVLKAGARDFVVKHRMARLVPAIDRELREAANQRRLHASEATLHQMRERTQFALEAVGIGTWEADVRSGRMVWSEVMQRLHGQEPGTFGGTFDDFVAAIHPDDREAMLERIARAVKERSDSRLEYRSRWTDGSEHWIVGIGRTLCDEHGTVVGAVGVSMDITAQKHLEEQVRQAQKMESIGNLAGGVAHDFNNLLTVIAGECEFAAPRVASDPELSVSLDAIGRAAASATALTRQLLTFSRRTVVSPRVVDLNQILDGFGTIVRRLVEANVRVEFRFAPTATLVRIDPGQIEQLLLNLVTNARDAMADGGTVTVETCQVKVDAGAIGSSADVPPGSYVELSVVDTGCGLAPDVRAHLFEPFVTTKPVGRGTGLGLATVHGIVTQNGGHIVVDSKPGAGTSFRIYLPAVAPSAQSPAAPQAERASDLHGSETILVVEDSLPLRRLAERILRQHGYQVLVAASGTQAQQVFADHDDAIAAVLTDVIMPDGSGPALAEWVAARRPATRILFMSGYAGEHRVQHHGHGFLHKPFTASQLVGALRDVLGAPDDSPSSDLAAVK